MKKTLSLVLTLVLLACLAGCSKEVSTITDFSEFSDMSQSGTDKVEVTFDNHSGVPFYFSVEDREEIEEIMSIIFSSSFGSKHKEMNPGDNTSITIIQGEKEYHIHTCANKEGRYYYSFSNANLQTKIQELAKKVGAYENVD